MVSSRETGILLPNNQRQHRTSHALKDVLPLRTCANYCAPCQHGEFHPHSICVLGCLAHKQPTPPPGTTVGIPASCPPRGAVDRH